MYKQCILEYEPFVENKHIIDTIWIPSKFAIVNKKIIIKKNNKTRYAKVLKVCSSEEKTIVRKKWEVGGL